MKVRFESRSDIGRRRTSNEDSLLASSEQGLFIVADGMGGHAAGEVASRMAVDTVAAFVSARAGGPDAAAPGAEGVLPGDDAETWPFGYDHDQPPQANLLRNALLHANRVLIEATRERRQYRGMATTIVAVLLDGDVAHIAHAGDSRAYLLRAGRLQRLTRDHSWVSERVQSGELTEPEARVHPLRNMVTRALGGKNDLEVDVQAPRLQPGDVLLLCSDGLTSMVPEDEIARLLAGEPEAAVSRLVDAANERGGDDNVSVLVLRAEP